MPIKIKEVSVELSIELMQYLLKTFQGHKQCNEMILKVKLSLETFTH